MELSSAAQWAEVIGLITILGAAIYSWFQIKELKESRRSAATLSLANLFQSGVESDFEWFQWLAERIIEYDEGKKIQPAHIAYRDWQPPNQ